MPTPQALKNEIQSFQNQNPNAKRWPPSLKSRILSHCESRPPGESLRTFAENLDLDADMLYRWRAKAARKQQALVANPAPREVRVVGGLGFEAHFRTARATISVSFS